MTDAAPSTFHEPQHPGAGDDAVPVILRDTPSGYDWGFYASEEPRMHLQTVRGVPACKVWLEREGHWVIERTRDVPTKVFNALKNGLENEPLLAWRVRAAWVRQMVVKGRLRFQTSGDRVILTAYPGTPHEFERAIHLPAHAPRSFFMEPDKDVSLNADTASLVIGARRPEHEWVMVNLADLLWEGTG